MGDKLGKVAAAILGALIGGFASGCAIVVWLGWGIPTHGQKTHIDPTRSDYVDLLLTLATIFLGAVGLAVTVAALVIGIVALKTMQEIKDDAANAAKEAAQKTVGKIMDTDLEPQVKKDVAEVLPKELRVALMDDELGHKILGDMAERGELNGLLERVIAKVQFGGPDGVEDEHTDYEGE